METAVAESGADLELLGWRQGSILPPALFQAVQAATGMLLHDGSSVPIVLSQDCDVVNSRLKDEPMVEIIRAVRVEKPNGTLTRGKSTRRLQLPITLKGTGQHYFELFIHDRGFIDKRLLFGKCPDHDLLLAEADTRVLAAWMGRRYKRHSFPTAFANRLREKKTSKALEKLFTDHGEDVDSVWMLINPADELPANKNYALIVYIHLRKEEFDEEDGRQRLEKEFLEPLTTILSGADGIELGQNDVMLVSQEDVTLHDIRFLRRMDLDYLSPENEGDSADAA